MKISLHAASSNDLLNVLRLINISVPGRTEGRKAWHCENWSICRFLGSYASEDLLVFPLSLDGDSEAPDYLFAMPNTTVGIEVTEACDQMHSWARAIAEQTPGATIDLSRFAPRDDLSEVPLGRPRLGRIDQPPGGPGWLGLEVERQWLKYIRASINHKSAALGKRTYARHDDDWLLIYDNTPGFNLHLEEALAMLAKSLESYWSQSDRFGRILVESGNQIMEVAQDFSRLTPLFDVCQHGEAPEVWQGVGGSPY